MNSILPISVCGPTFRAIYLFPKAAENPFLGLHNSPFARRGTLFSLERSAVIWKMRWQEIQYLAGGGLQQTRCGLVKAAKGLSDDFTRQPHIRTNQWRSEPDAPRAGFNGHSCFEGKYQNTVPRDSSPEPPGAYTHFSASSSVAYSKP